MIAFLKDNLVLFESIPKYKVSFVVIHYSNFIISKRIDDDDDDDDGDGDGDGDDNSNNILYEWGIWICIQINIRIEKSFMKNVYALIQHRIDHQTFELSLCQ